MLSDLESYSRTEMIGILRQLDRELNRPIQKSEIDKVFSEGKGPALNSYVREFGRLRKARKAASVKRASITKGHCLWSRHWQKYSKQEVIGQLQALGSKLGGKPMDRDINRQPDG